MIWPFYLMAIVALLSTIRVVTNTNPVHALLNLIVSLLAVAGIFFMVGAPFAGALEVIVYAGAIMVLFVFVVMMLNLGAQTSHQEKLWLNSAAWTVPALLTFLLGLALVWMLASGNTGSHPALGTHAVGPKQVGIALFGQYLLLVEVAALLLLAALVGAFHLGKRDSDLSNTDFDVSQFETSHLGTQASISNSEQDSQSTINQSTTNLSKTSLSKNSEVQP